MHSPRLLILLVSVALLAAPRPATGFRSQRPEVRQAAPPPRVHRAPPAGLRSLGRNLVRRYRSARDSGARLRKTTGTRLRRLSHGLVERGKRIGAASRKAFAGAAAAAKSAGRWARKHPAKAVGLGLGTVAMFGTVFYLAPALSTGVATCLSPVVGETAAGIIGTASGGALACGSRSLLVHATPMVTGVDPFNARQLTTDVSMSSTFGFFGFAQAAALRSLTSGLGATGLGLLAANYVGLVGYEVGKDYLQNRIRNRVANDPKRFRDIWKSSLLMETASNLHRCIPGLGLETSFGAKIVGDLGGTIWWDRIVNKRNKTPKNAHVHDAITE